MLLRELSNVMVVSLILACLLLLGGKAAQKPMSVCDLIQEPGKYEGRLVTIRGYVELFSPGNGELDIQELSSGDCPSKKEKSKSVGVIFPDSHFLEHPPEGYRIDEESFRRAARKVKNAMSQGPSVKRLLATVKGIAYAGNPGSQQADNSERPHHKQYSAYIVIASIDDVGVVPY